MTVELPNWLAQKSLILTNLQWIGILATILISFIVERISRFIVNRHLIKLLAKLHLTVDKQGQKKSVAPVGIFAFALVWITGLKLLNLPTNIYTVLSKAGVIAVIVGLVLTAYSIIDILAAYLEKKARQTENKLDDVIVPLVKKTLKFFVVAIGIITVGDSLNLNMKGIITGLGIGGFAFAFAAKDTISNLFGSLTVIVDHPFTIGDWIIIDGKIEGTVIEVGMRSTRIRTFYDSIISIPNGMLTNVHIDNMGKRNFRRFSTKLNIEYDTPPEKIEAFCEGIRQIILRHKWTRKDLFHVYLNELNSSSLDILLYVFWSVPDWSTELNERHRLLIDIIRLAKKLDIAFAFPTQTLHLFNEEHSSTTVVPKIEESFHLAKQAATTITNTPITMEHPRSGIDENGVKDFKEDKLSL